MDWGQIFAKDTKPDMSQIAKETDNPLWQLMIKHLETTYKVEPKIEYSCCSFARGWNVKYKKSGRSLCVLYPQKDFFTTLVCIGANEELEAKFLLSTCSEYTQNLYEKSEGVNGTKWMMIEVTSQEILQDTQKLISTRVTKQKR